MADAITDMERLRRHAVAELKHVRHIWMLGFDGGAVTPPASSGSRNTTPVVCRYAAPISVANRSRVIC